MLDQSGSVLSPADDAVEAADNHNAAG